MIFFVDEEMGECSPYSIALAMQGFVVTTLPDATIGLAELSILRDDVELVFIDVMLARGSDPDQLFRPDLTAQGLKTGLRLLDALAEANATLFPRHAVLLSAATDQDLVRTIESESRRHRVPFWRKTDFRTTSDFVTIVKSHLQAFLAPDP